MNLMGCPQPQAGEVTIVTASAGDIEPQLIAISTLLVNYE
jgi:hypothetical protein